MSEPLSPELEQKAQELATRIHSRSAESVLELARRLVATKEETLFGETEFTLRDEALRIVGHAYAEHIEKKVATLAQASSARTADKPHRSTTIAKKRSRRSAGR